MQTSLTLTQQPVGRILDLLHAMTLVLDELISCCVLKGNLMHTSTI